MYDLFGVGVSPYLYGVSLISICPGVGVSPNTVPALPGVAYILLVLSHLETLADDYGPSTEIDNLPLEGVSHFYGFFATFSYSQSDLSYFTYSIF